MRGSSHPLTWPKRAMALAAGLAAGAMVHLDSTLPSAVAVVVGLVATALVFVAWANETPLSRRWPRARRPQWAARVGLLGAALAAVPHPATMLCSPLLVGVAAGLLVRETKTPVASLDTVVSFVLGGAIGVATTLGPSRLGVAGTALALVIASVATLAATFRGGPGRPPARPADVLWLYALGAALAVALGLR